MSASGWLLGGTALCAGVFGGAMFAFSTFVLPALGRVAPRDAVVAMQAMNERAPVSLLMLPLGGVAIGSLAVVATSLLWEGPDRGLRLAGGALALASFVVTGVGNVPLNNRLATVVADSATGADWLGFAEPWLAWNGARTLSALAGAVLLAGAAARA